MINLISKSNVVLLEGANYDFDHYQESDTPGFYFLCHPTNTCITKLKGMPLYIGAHCGTDMSAFLFLQVGSKVFIHIQDEDFNRDVRVRVKFSLDDKYFRQLCDGANNQGLFVWFLGFYLVISKYKIFYEEECNTRPPNKNRWFGLIFNRQD